MLTIWKLTFSFNFVMIESLWILKDGTQIRGGASYQLCTLARYFCFELFVEVVTAVFHHAIAQLLKEDVDSWYTFPPACLHVRVLAIHEEGTKTAPFISYDVPVSGIHEKQSLLIFRELQSTGLLLHACIYSAVLRKFHTCKQLQHL